MSKIETERLIQTAQHSNPQVVIMGTVENASGEIEIDWETSHKVVFITTPIILAIYPDEVPTSRTTQPMCYHQEWIKDGEFYTGMVVYSAGVGTNIHWAVQGKVKK
jgi:hypothetical protein